jgi:hypothetical protein
VSTTLEFVQAITTKALEETSATSERAGLKSGMETAFSGIKGPSVVTGLRMDGAGGGLLVTSSIRTLGTNRADLASVVVQLPQPDMPSTRIVRPSFDEQRTRSDCIVFLCSLESFFSVGMETFFFFSLGHFSLSLRNAGIHAQFLNSHPFTDNDMVSVGLEFSSCWFLRRWPYQVDSFSRFRD